MSDQSWPHVTLVSRLVGLATAVAVLALVMSNVTGLAVARLGNSNVPTTHSFAAKKPITVPIPMNSTARKPIN